MVPEDGLVLYNYFAKGKPEVSGELLKVHVDGPSSICRVLMRFRLIDCRHFHFQLRDVFSAVGLSA